MSKADEPAYRVRKDGVVWDYSQHPADPVDWRLKILLEEPEAEVVIEEATYKDMYEFKTGEKYE